MSQNLQNFAKFQKFQLDNLVDFEKCCKTHIFLQRSVPIQPKTNNILPKFCQKLATTTSPADSAKSNVEPGFGRYRGAAHRIADQAKQTGLFLPQNIHVFNKVASTRVDTAGPESVR